MQNKYLVLVEGVADLIFFRDYLIFLDSSLKLKTKKIKHNLVLESDDKKIDIRAIGGYTEVENSTSTIEVFNDQGAIVLVIQDADNPQKDNGGVENRMVYLKEVKEALSVKFETFLFPNHKDDGDLETLLLQIAKQDKFNLANNCYSPFVECLGVISTSVASELAKDKSKIFNYFRAYYGIQSAKEVERVYEQDYWDFTSNALDELLIFMQVNNIIPNLINTKD